MRGIDGRVAIVTGAGQGIGRAICERLLEEGASVFATDINSDGRNIEGLASLATRDRVATLAIDLTTAEAPALIIQHCIAAFGSLGILVNNAGIGNAPPVHETTDEIYDRYMAINLRATFRLSRDALPELRKSKGVVVNIASSVGLSGYRRLAAYAASKAGVAALTRSMASDYGPEGIRVNAVAPGVIATPMTAGRLQTARFRAVILGTMPLGLVGQPEDVAAAVAFLASAEARMITGQVLAIDGGQTSSVFISDELIAAFEAAAESP